MFRVGLNFDDNQVAKWVHRKVCHHFEPDAKRRHKLIAMAQECASIMMFSDWDMVPWDPEFVSMDMLEILAASNECRTLEGATQIAWLLGGNDVILRKAMKHVGQIVGCKLGQVHRSVKKFNHVDLCQEHLSQYIGQWSGASVLENFSDELLPEKFPLFVGNDPGVFNSITPSESLCLEYKTEWYNALNYLRSLNNDGKVLASPNDFKVGYARCLIASIAIGAMLLRFGTTDKTVIDYSDNTSEYLNGSLSTLGNLPHPRVHRVLARVFIF